MNSNSFLPSHIQSILGGLQDFANMYMYNDRKRLNIWKNENEWIDQDTYGNDVGLTNDATITEYYLQKLFCQSFHIDLLRKHFKCEGNRFGWKSHYQKRKCLEYILSNKITQDLQQYQRYL
jgi:hypothetical protein